ncbi:MAG TPA: AAA family ATPase [Verrucomicrobiae bacterium]|nr:AAA family ATPase [Verrucomicrobiae bacterium]
MSKPNVLAEPVLVGRERELEELNRELQMVLKGKGRTVLISAEAGIGKTRLVTEFLKSVKTENMITLSGWCLQNAEIPYFPFIEAFSNYYSTVSEKESKEEAELNSWLKGDLAKSMFSGQLKYLNPQALKDQTFASVAKAIHSIATHNPVIFVLEDVHWADSASLALMHYIARSVHESERVLVLATFRSEELTNDSEGYPRPVSETLSAMRREDLFRKIELSGLTQSSIAQLAESMLGGRLQQSLAEKLAVDSEGNPLFVVESMRMLYESKSLYQENNTWRLDTEKFCAPLKIREILIQRLACLNNAQRRILDAASVIGDCFEAGLLSAVIEMDTLEVLETLNVIAHATSLILTDESHYRFDHARSREIIYESLSQPLKQEYHKRIAETLENTKGKTLPLSELSHHYAQAGNRGKAIEYALEAGREALLKWSNSEAIKHFEYALENLPKERKKEKLTALEGLGDAYFENNMFKQATKTFEDLSNNQTGAAKLRALTKAMFSDFQQADIPHLIELIKKAEPYVAADRLESARVLSFRGVVSWLNLPHPLGLMRDVEDQEAALRVFEEEYSLWDVGAALLRSGGPHASLGEVHKGLAESLHAFALYEELGDLRVQMAAGYHAGQTFFGCGLPNEALGMSAKVMEIAKKTKIGASIRLFFTYAYSSRAYEFMGDWEEALSHSLKALELSKITETLIAQAIAYSNLTRIYIRLGNLKRAEEYFENLMELPQEVVLDPRVLLNLTRAVFLASKGQWKESNDCFKEYIHTGPSWLAKSWFAWALEEQGQSEEARVGMEDIQKALNEADEKFAHVCLQTSLMARREVIVGEEFEMHLDLVNVSKKPAFLVKVGSLIPSEWAKVTALPLWCSLQNNDFEMNIEIGAFQVVTAKLTLRPMKTGTFTLNAKVEYLDDLGVSKTYQFDPIAVTVKPSISKGKFEVASEPCKFESEAVEKAFRYLADAFKNDQLGMPLEKSGWRTLMQVMRDAKITKNDLYGRSGHGGKILSSLEQMGLIETMYFSGERGRGGRVLKVRCMGKSIEK